MKAIDLLNSGSTTLKLNKIYSHQLDSELLLSKVLKSKREKILINLEQEIKPKDVLKFLTLIKRRSNNEPVSYITNEKEFWSKTFFVNKFTLIPRPETELMIEKLSMIFKNKRISILDIGTGSGCILLSLLSEIKNAKGIGIDISKGATEIARKNARILKLTSRAKFFNLSFKRVFNKKFDLIVSNPPYIKQSQIKNLDSDIKNFEPKIALDGGNDGLDVIKKVIYKAKNILKNKGTLSLEIGKEQHKKVLKILQSNNFLIKYIVNDYKDNIRCIISTLNI